MRPEKIPDYVSEWPDDLQKRYTERWNTCKEDEPFFFFEYDPLIFYTDKEIKEMLKGDNITKY